ncbi:glycosyltransferase family 4 protein [Aminobacter sp. AP02]|uniref:glycosyltransferase family 4 protein n=1 Tax=Aminobacter sp. AP02 TaxID=2135737 RepID=UPI000D6CB3B2|nr:glycosyltransferase family 4 protein [Aminobacter sp. AP02]PWK67546.1 glycosyltransferase involved in cell wall biosynthesis [Aminobacter sp. AP02]
MNAKATTVCFPFIGDLFGGSHLSALGLIKNLDHSRFSPLVVLQISDGPVAEIFRREGVQFETAPAQTHLARGQKRDGAAVATVARTLPAFTRFLKARDAAIVHTNDGRTHIAWGLAARFAGSKHLWHHRNDSSSFGLRRVAPWLSHHVVAVSKFASPRPALISAAGKCSVVHSPFDVNMSAGMERSEARSKVLAEIGVPAETQLFGYVGTLVERKRPVLFVEALAAMKRMAPDMKLAGLLLGNSLNGLDDQAKSRAEALGIAEHIHFLGFRYPVEPWVAALDALLVTAVDEPLGRTIVEAMLLGTPVVAADSGGNPEAIEDGETGLLVRPDEPDEFAKAGLKLVREPSMRRHIVETARSNARARFSVERHVREITRVHKTACGTLLPVT